MLVRRCLEMSAGYDHPRFKAAAVQAGPVYWDEPRYFDLEATLEKAIGLKERLISP